MLRHPLREAFRHPGIAKCLAKRMTSLTAVLLPDHGDTDRQHCLLIAGAKPVLQACYLDGVQGQSLNLKQSRGKADLEDLAEHMRK
jgi:hypothetical protein